MRLVLRDAGPIGDAEPNLSGVVFLYGPHGGGKTTAARALSATSISWEGSVETSTHVLAELIK